MVETKNNYKHKRYNNNRRGNFRNFKNNNSEQKGLLNFLFSVNGKISKADAEKLKNKLFDATNGKVNVIIV